MAHVVSAGSRLSIPGTLLSAKPTCPPSLFRSSFASFPSSFFPSHPHPYPLPIQYSPRAHSTDLDTNSRDAGRGGIITLQRSSMELGGGAPTHNPCIRGRAVCSSARIIFLRPFLSPLCLHSYIYLRPNYWDHNSFFSSCLVCVQILFDGKQNIPRQSCRDTHCVRSLNA